MFRILPGTKMARGGISSTLSAASMEMAGDSACAALPVTRPSSWCATRASIPVGRTSNKLNRHILKRGLGPSSRLPGPERNRRPASPGDGPAGQDICAYAEAASRRVRTDTHLACPEKRGANSRSATGQVSGGAVMATHGSHRTEPEREPSGRDTAGRSRVEAE